MATQTVKKASRYPSWRDFKLTPNLPLKVEQIVLNQNRPEELHLQFPAYELFTNTGMPLFAYTARETATGREIRNTVEALSEQAAIAALLNRNMLVVEIKE